MYFTKVCIRQDVFIYLLFFRNKKKVKRYSLLVTDTVPVAVGASVAVREAVALVIYSRKTYHYSKLFLLLILINVYNINMCA